MNVKSLRPLLLTLIWLISPMVAAGQYATNLPLVTEIPSTRHVLVISNNTYFRTTVGNLGSVIGSSNVVNLFATNVYTTNLFAGDTYVTNLYSTNIFGGDTYTTNLYVTNLFAGDTYVTNLFSTNIFGGDTYTTNLYVTNLFAGDTYVTNLFTTNLFAGDTYTTNLYVTNITANKISVTEVYVSNITATNNLFLFTNLWAGPTNFIDLSKGRQSYLTVTPVEITGIIGKSNTVPSSALLGIRNGAATNITLTLHTNIWTGDYARVYTVSNGVIAYVSVDYDPSFDATNAVFRDFR